MSAETYTVHFHMIDILLQLTAWWSPGGRKTPRERRLSITALIHPDMQFKHTARLMHTL